MFARKRQKIQKNRLSQIESQFFRKLEHSFTDWHKVKVRA
jgi:hypothetical protein